eukprot:m.47733 g.47733  ORF g.47733 m.47733 type:complete len:172 (-) comp10990_c0_seq2:589-1104(-)
MHHYLLTFTFTFTSLTSPSSSFLLSLFVAAHFTFQNHCKTITMPYVTRTTVVTVHRSGGSSNEISFNPLALVICAALDLVCVGVSIPWTAWLLMIGALFMMCTCFLFVRESQAGRAFLLTTLLLSMLSFAMFWVFFFSSGLLSTRAYHTSLYSAFIAGGLQLLGGILAFIL